MKRRRCSGRSQMMRLGSSLEERIRKTGPPHEIRCPPPLRRSRKAARRILEIANSVEPAQGRVHIEKVNEPFLTRDGGSPAEDGAGIKLAIERGWLVMHELRNPRHPHCGRRRTVA
jgi:hypothetical protein